MLKDFYTNYTCHKKTLRWNNCVGKSVRAKKSDFYFKHMFLACTLINGISISITREKVQPHFLHFNGASSVASSNPTVL